MISLESIITAFKPILIILLIVIIGIIIIGIIKLSLQKRKNTTISNIEKKTKGDNYELYVAKKYEDKGYHVYKKGIEEGMNDGGIDIIATLGEQAILIQCKNWDVNGSYKVRTKEIREFYGSCNFHIDEHHLNRNNTTCIYIVNSNNLIPLKSKALFKKHHDKCRYEIIEY